VSICCYLHVHPTTARLNEKLYRHLPDWANTESIWEPGHGKLMPNSRPGFSPQRPRQHH
jgi:hypothetical protein